jgi:hypothetical protein
VTEIQEESAVVIFAVIECTIFRGVVKSVEWIVAAVRFAVEPDSGSPTGLPSPDSATMIPSVLAPRKARPVVPEVVPSLDFSDREGKLRPRSMVDRLDRPSNPFLTFLGFVPDSLNSTKKPRRAGD